jgi:hypothetical protein
MKFSMFISPDGTCHAVYSDTIRKLMPGPVEVSRVSSVEFDHVLQQWKAVDDKGVILATAADRDTCLEKEKSVVEESLRTRLVDDLVESMPVIEQTMENTPEKPNTSTEESVIIQPVALTAPPEVEPAPTIPAAVPPPPPTGPVPERRTVPLTITWTEFLAGYGVLDKQGKLVKSLPWDSIPDVLLGLIGDEKLKARQLAHERRCWTYSGKVGAHRIVAGMNMEDRDKVGYIITQHPWILGEDSVVQGSV